MKTLTASMIFLMVIAGCKTSSYVVDTKQSQVDYDFEEFDRYMEQRDCTIAFSSGEEEDAKEITSAKFGFLEYICQDKRTGFSDFPCTTFRSDR